MQMVASTSQGPHKLLVIHQGALGDFILTFPALDLLNRQTGPVDVLCQARLGHVACRLGLAERYYSLDSAAFVSLFTAVLEAPAEAILKTYDTILLISFSTSVEKVLRGGLPARIYRVPPRPPDQTKIHVAEYIVKKMELAGLAESVGVGVVTPGWPEGRNRPRADQSRILLHPGAGSHRKRHPLEHFKAIFDALQEAGMKPVVVIGPAEQDLTHRIAHEWNHEAPLVISDLDLLMDTLEVAGGLIGNDSGVSHLSAWMGLPTVACFGPTDPACWRPLGPRVSAVQPPRSDSAESSGSNGLGNATAGLEDISPKKVLDEFITLWNVSSG